jgi:hypothetical protein
MEQKSRREALFSQCAKKSFLCYTVVMSRRLASLAYLLWFAPVSTLARQLPLNIGPVNNVETILTRLINYMAYTVVFAASAMFAVGALYITFSRGESDLVKRGKGLIIGAVVGSAIVLGAFTILRTMMYVIYS